MNANTHRPLVPAADANSAWAFGATATAAGGDALRTPTLTVPDVGVGPTGLVAPAALTGPAGRAALTGPAGRAALTGPAGPAALTGPTGLTGPADPTGLTGPTGPVAPAAPANPVGGPWALPPPRPVATATPAVDETSAGAVPLPSSRRQRRDPHPQARRGRRHRPRPADSGRRDRPPTPTPGSRRRVAVRDRPGRPPSRRHRRLHAPGPAVNTARHGVVPVAGPAVEEDPAGWRTTSPMRPPPQQASKPASQQASKPAGQQASRAGRLPRPRSHWQRPTTPSARSSSTRPPVSTMSSPRPLRATPRHLPEGSRTRRGHAAP